MNVAQLGYFCHLAKTQHYTQAARELNITQPALSHSIAMLERELDCQLFRKVGRNVKLTEDGRVFAAYAERALREIEDGREELKRRHGLLQGDVRIGAIATVRSGYLPAAMKAYADRYGSLVEFHVFQGETAPLNQKLEDGLLDMTITGPVHRPNLICVTLFYQQLVVAVRADHPLASLPCIRYENLIGYDINTYRRGIACGETLEAFFHETHAPLSQLHLIRNYEDEVILGALTVHEDSVALTMATSNLIPNPKMVLLPLDVPGAKEFYPISLIYPKKSDRNQAVQSFIQFLKEFQAPAYSRNDIKE
ncbi:MAG: LysR family transcriptional regulator [Eggerthellaceae bacterium]|jgi:DNA-binding transcriptional LysR family regulator